MPTNAPCLRLVSLLTLALTGSCSAGNKTTAVVASAQEFDWVYNTWLKDNFHHNLRKESRLEAVHRVFFDFKTNEYTNSIKHDNFAKWDFHRESLLSIFNAVKKDQSQWKRDPSKTVARNFQTGTKVALFAGQGAPGGNLLFLTERFSDKCKFNWKLKIFILPMHAARKGEDDSGFEAVVKRVCGLPAVEVEDLRELSCPEYLKRIEAISKDEFTVIIESVEFAGYESKDELAGRGITVSADDQAKMDALIDLLNTPETPNDKVKKKFFVVSLGAPCNTTNEHGFIHVSKDGKACVTKIPKYYIPDIRIELGLPRESLLAIYQDEFQYSLTTKIYVSALPGMGQLFQKGLEVLNPQKAAALETFLRDYQWNEFIELELPQEVKLDAHMIPVVNLGINGFSAPFVDSTAPLMTQVKVIPVSFTSNDGGATREWTWKGYSNSNVKLIAQAEVA